jgi:hypothetical protein
MASTTPEALLDAKHPRLATFIKQLPSVSVTQWLIICDRYQQTSSQIAGARQVVAGIITGADLHISADEQKKRRSAADRVLEAVAEALSELPPHSQRNGHDFPLAQLAAEASTAAVQALMTRDVLVTRENGPTLFQVLTSPFSTFVHVGA